MTSHDRPPISEARGVVVGLAIMAAIGITAGLFVGFAAMRERGVPSIPQHVEAR